MGGNVMACKKILTLPNEAQNSRDNINKEAGCLPLVKFKLSSHRLGCY